MSTLPKLVVIVGPTSSGKTDLGIYLAKEFNGEVVSADSRQVYREFTIGTGKPEGHWMSVSGKQLFVAGGVPHHLIDEIDPKEEFTLVDFKKRATGAINDIHSRNRLPLLVGGTALYVYAVTENLDIPAIPPDIAFRSRLESKPTETLLAELTKKDPEAAELTGPNKRRIIRALEVIEKTGKKFSQQRSRGPKIFETLKIGIAVEKSELENRLRKRIEGMFKAGLEKEVAFLAAKYSWDIPPMQSIDYQEFKEYLQGKETLESVKERLLKNHLELARHQQTWFKRDKEINWINSPAEAKTLAENFL